DIVALMEVDEAWLDKLDVALWMMPFQRAVPRNDNFGIAIFSKAPIRKVHDMSDAGEVPSIAVDIDVWGHPTTLVVTHPLPPMTLRYHTLRNEQLAAISQMRDQFHDRLILMGDLNTTSWSQAFSNLMREMKLHDSRQG